MEMRRNIINIIERACTITGFTILVISVITYFVGEHGVGLSSLFELGNKGISLKIIAEYSVFALLISIMQFAFFTDYLIKKWSITLRVVVMIALQICMVGVFAFFFKWFPVDDLKCWGMFFICFFICFLISVVVSGWKETKENTKLEEGLKALKKQADLKQGRENV